MTDEKINEVLDKYEKDVILEDHLVLMISKIRKFLVEGRREKAMRWLGFIQRVLWAEDIYTIDELKEHNRTDHMLVKQSIRESAEATGSIMEKRRKSMMATEPRDPPDLGRSGPICHYERGCGPQGP